MDNLITYWGTKYFKVRGMRPLSDLIWESGNIFLANYVQHICVPMKAYTWQKYQPGLTPNMLIAHLWKIAPPPIFLCEPHPPLAIQTSAIVLKELKCVVVQIFSHSPLNFHVISWPVPGVL